MMLNVKDIMNLSVKPKLYQKGTAVMWTDPYISKQLLDVHLNPDVDLASRKEKTINETVNSELLTSNAKSLEFA